MDETSDNANCGGCNKPCAAPQQCAGGTCASEVATDAGATLCANGGPPIIFAWDGGSECAGSVAQLTFRWALCSCQSLTNLSAPLMTDGFDSSQGPYAPDGGGGGVGCNGDFSGSSNADIGGAFWVGGSGGVAGSEVMSVLQDVEIAGPLNVHSLMCGGDATVEGNINVNQTSDVQGTLFLSTGDTVTGWLDAGAVVVETLSVTPPCDCSAAELVPVAAIVAARATSNDDALIGLNPAVFASGTASGSRLDLPCGNYYLTSIQTSGPVAIVAHGNVALYVGGDVVPSAELSLTLDAASEFDVFIAGNLCASAGLNIGNPNYPAQMRLYVGGDNACGKAGDGIRLSGQNTLASNLYASNGITTSAPLVEYGGIFAAGDFAMSAPATIHYDRGVLGAAANCPVPDAGGCQSCRDCGNQACVGGQCGACASSADCCSPLACQAGACVPEACVPLGGACQQNMDCCSPSWCLTGNGGRCDGQSNCTCGTPPT